MTIQRQYSLPNCKLVLQGLSDAADLSGRPLLSMVTNVECYLAGQKEPFTGGRAFLDSLATTVSDYAQAYLSGIQHLIRRERQQSSLVQIERVESNLHRLTVRSEAEPEAAKQIHLTTVQLFDLVEAVDQLFADAQTLPDLTLKLNPLSKRYVAAAEPVAKRVVPMAVGLSSLAAAAAILFVLPAPQVRRPDSTTSSTATGTTSPTPSPNPSATASPVAPAATSTPTGSPTASATPTASPSATPLPNQSSEATNVQEAGLSLADAPEITDTTELDRLTVQLYDKLDLSWKKKPTFDGELIYRVGVNRAGNIVGYKYTNDAALTYLNDTPLADVQFRAPEASSSPTPTDSPKPTAKEPLAQFRVVFKSNGVLEVSPWDGQPSKAGATGTSSTNAESPAPSPSASP